MKTSPKRFSASELRRMPVVEPKVMVPLADPGVVPELAVALVQFTQPTVPALAWPASARTAAHIKPSNNLPFIFSSFYQNYRKNYCSLNTH
jgi:hypothetical protein